MDNEEARFRGALWAIMDRIIEIRGDAIFLRRLWKTFKFMENVRDFIWNVLATTNEISDSAEILKRH